MIWTTPAMAIASAMAAMMTMIIQKKITILQIASCHYVFFLSFFLSYVLKACAKQLLNRDLISQRWLMLLQSKMCEKTDWELWLTIAKIKTRFLKTRPLFVYFRSFHKNISMKSSLAAVKGKRFHECAVYLFLV